MNDTRTFPKTEGHETPLWKGMNNQMKKDPYTKTGYPKRQNSRDRWSCELPQRKGTLYRAME